VNLYLHRLGSTFPKYEGVPFNKEEIRKMLPDFGFDTPATQKRLHYEAEKLADVFKKKE